MTQRVTKQVRPETVDAKYNRLSRRVVRRLPVTAAESRWLWNERSRRERAALAARAFNRIGDTEPSAPTAQGDVA